MESCMWLFDWRSYKWPRPFLKVNLAVGTLYAKFIGLLVVISVCAVPNFVMFHVRLQRTSCLHPNAVTGRILYLLALSSVTCLDDACRIIATRQRGCGQVDWVRWHRSRQNRIEKSAPESQNWIEWRKIKSNYRCSAIMFPVSHVPVSLPQLSPCLQSLRLRNTVEDSALSPTNSCDEGDTR